MARKKKHEEHVNAEAWAIPYGDLVTLLFALFTVMYAMSSVNEGKFRVLSDSMIAAFNGAPKSMRPVNIGDRSAKGGDKPLGGEKPTALVKVKLDKPSTPSADPAPRDSLVRMERQVQNAMQSLIDAKMVTVKRENQWLEIEINTDILFPSGAGEFSSAAEPVLDQLAEVLKPFPNPIRVEGHTDNRPIRTAAFPSNWELSAARAASVVHEFSKAGIDPLRLEIVGFGEFHPRQSNDSVEGRNANRRVSVLVLEEVAPDAPARVPPAEIEKAVLSKDDGAPDESGKPAITPPAQHIGPVDLVWPGAETVSAAPAGEHKPPTAAHE